MNLVKKAKAPPLSEPIARDKHILSHLLSGRTLTQGESVALGYGPQPIAASVFRLKRLWGHNIEKTMKADIHGTRYAEYRLVTRNRFGERVSASEKVAA